MNLNVNLCGHILKNPLIGASGTFGYGEEFSPYFDVCALGGICSKGLTLHPREGNFGARMWETPAGMLNSIGLQNPGARAFIQNDLPFLKRLDTKIIVNLCGHTIEQYVQVAQDFDGVDVDMFELNISCPNISEGGMAFGTDEKMVEAVVSSVKACVKAPLIVKLSPNVTDIAAIAVAAQRGGADAVSLINTVMGMKIDIHRRKPVLANKIGGLSGPAIKPIAVRMVWQVAKSVSIPVIGMGGISTGEDAIEFIMAGAAAIAVGTANFVNPTATVDILSGIESFMDRHGVKDLEEIRGIV